MDATLRQRRHRRIRARMHGNKAKPRASIFRSLRYIYVQLIDDDAGVTLASSRGNFKHAHEVGKDVAKQAKNLGVKRVAFDRGGYRYHGRVKALAEGMRAGGLLF